MWVQVQVRDDKLFAVLAVMLIGMAWLTLWVWGLSPYGRYVDHRQLADLSLEGGFGNVLVVALLFVAGWTLMTVAMMLPTTLPLITIFRRLTARRPDNVRLVALLIVGYLGIWGSFGVVAHIGDWGLHEAVEQSGWLQSHEWAIAAGIFMLAGVYQFTPLKYHCLEKCRSPFSFVTQHWRGKQEHREALLLGVHHGLFCVGCCWSLMLLMFAVGVGNIGWMLALGAVMAVEKNVPWGRTLSAPLGATLLALGLVTLLVPSWPS